MTQNSKEIEDAMWAGDTEKLYKLAPCICCCDEHTFSYCPARAWSGCKGSATVEDDPESWRKVYGMTEEEFYV